VTHLALLVAGGAALSLLEGSLPRPLPWMKIGLANVATILALYLYGARPAFSVAVLRVLLGGVFLGFGPGFVLSAGGGIAAWGVMALVKETLGSTFSVVGVSIWGALTHNLTQLFLAHLLVRTAAVWALLPAFLWAAGVTGTITGLAADFGLKLLRRHPRCGIRP